MTQAECMRCSFRQAYPHSTAARVGMLEHSKHAHPIPVPGWTETDPQGFVTHHGIAALRKKEMADING